MQLCPLFKKVMPKQGDLRCESVFLALISGFILSRWITHDQIQTSFFSNINTALFKICVRRSIQIDLLTDCSLQARRGAERPRLHAFWRKAFSAQRRTLTINYKAAVCNVCKRVWQKTHPDLHWLGPDAQPQDTTSKEKTSKTKDLKLMTFAHFASTLFPHPSRDAHALPLFWMPTDSPLSRQMHS